MNPDKDLVHGEIDDYLVFIPRTEALRLVAVHRAINTSRTWGELKQSMPAGAYEQVVKLLREDQELPASWEPDAGAEFEADNIPGFTDRDWPEWPAQDALTWVPRDMQERFGRKDASVANGDYLELAVEHEAAIVTAFGEHGYTCTRDQELVLRAYVYA
jgi:hypothetical protein